MSVTKNPKYDLKRKYKRVIELGFVFSLIITISVFEYFPSLEKKEIVIKNTQELIDIQNVEITKHETAPPPPPKPAIPIEAPSEEVLEDIEIEDTELDVNEIINSPPPPPMLEDEDEDITEPVFFIVVEQMPRPVGGITAIQQKIEYPEIAKRAGIQGRVYIKAYVDESGSVNHVEVVKGIGAGCDEAAKAAVMQTQFIPGKQRGKPVKVQIVIPVLFKLVSGSNPA